MDAALAHGASGFLNTDWGDFGHLQYLPISEPGFAYGAAVSWCVDTNRDLDLAAALDAHRLRRPDRRARRRCSSSSATCISPSRPQVPNVSTLVLHLYWPELHLDRGLHQGRHGRRAAPRRRTARQRGEPNRAARVRFVMTASSCATSCATRSRSSRILVHDGTARLGGNGSARVDPARAARRACRRAPAGHRGAPPVVAGAQPARWPRRQLRVAREPAAMLRDRRGGHGPCRLNAARQVFAATTALAGGIGPPGSPGVHAFVAPSRASADFDNFGGWRNAGFFLKSTESSRLSALASR